MKNDIGKEFILKTTYDYLNYESDQQLGLTQPPVEAPYDSTQPLIDLPAPSTCPLSETNIRTLVDNRKSLRKYSEQAITREELSYLLWSTQGIKKSLKRDDNTYVTFRTVPSAGARHPFETYLLINHVNGIKPGIYRYIASQHKLLEVNTEEGIATKVVDASYGQVFISTSAVTFIWSVDIYRTKWRYNERAYRYVLLDAGHVCQNLYLSAESIDAGVCAIASYDDATMNTLLGLDGENQFVVYIGTVGKKPL
jgi:SagB-type dehydrogenase family enzyme